VDGELWDVTDAAGVPLGMTHPRGDPDFPVGRFHVVPAVCVVRGDGLVLITQRSAEKDWALDWEFPAGSALAGETSREGAVRELREETGLHAVASALTFVGRFTEELALLDLYVAHGLDTDVLTLDSDEVADAAWVSLDTVRERYRAGVFAEPWVARLDALFPSLVSAVRGEAPTQDPPAVRASLHPLTNSPADELTR